MRTNVVQEWRWADLAMDAYNDYEANRPNL
jgi:hypothetical protein